MDVNLVELLRQQIIIDGGHVTNHVQDQKTGQDGHHQTFLKDTEPCRNEMDFLRRASDLFSYLSLVLSLQPDSPLYTSSGLQERLSLSSVWQVMNGETGSVHCEVQQGLRQNLEGWKPAESADNWQRQKEERIKTYLSDDGEVTILTEDIQHQVQDGRDCPSNNRPQQREGQEGVSGEKREADVPGVITLCPNESTDQDLQNLREPADHRQVPETETVRHPALKSNWPDHEARVPAYLSHNTDIITSFLVSTSTQIPDQRMTEKQASQLQATPPQPDGHVSRRMMSLARMSIMLVTTSEVLRWPDENCWYSCSKSGDLSRWQEALVII